MSNCTVTAGIIFPESTSGLSVGTANCQKDLLVINFDLEPEHPDAELRATLQWIAASELGIPTIYFKKSQENRIEKVVFTELGILLIHFNHNSYYDFLKVVSLMEDAKTSLQQDGNATVYYRKGRKD